MEDVRLEITNFCSKIFRVDDRATFEYFWSDPRDVANICIMFEGNIHDATRKLDFKPVEGISYWVSTWPKDRPEPGVKEGSGQSGWKKKDDWYFGAWKKAYFEQDTRDVGGRVVVSCGFVPMDGREYAGEELGFTFRRTLKIKIKIKHEYFHLVSAVKIYTRTRCSPFTFRVMRRGKDATEPFAVEVFNGFIREGNSFSGQVSLVKAKVGKNIGIMKSNVVENYSFDKTLVKIMPGNMKPFTFSVDDLVKEHQLVIPDLGFVIHGGSQSNIGNGHEPAALSIYDRIFGEPEQDYARAMAEFHGKEPMHFVLSCEGTRAKAALSRKGNLHVSNRYLKSVREPDTSRVFWSDTFFRFSFILQVEGEEVELDPTSMHYRRSLQAGYLPIITTCFKKDGAELVHEAYATLLKGTDPGVLPDGDDVVVGMCKFTFKNHAPAVKQVTYSFLQSQVRNIGDGEGRPVFTASKVLAPPKTRHVAVQLTTAMTLEYQFIIVCDRDRVAVSLDKDHVLSVKRDVNPGEAFSMVVKVPFTCLGGKNGLEALYTLDYDAQKERVSLYWKDRLDGTSTISVPNEDINDFYKSQLIHALMTSDREVGSDLVFGRVGSLNYGTYANEVCMISMDLDRRGLFEEARKLLEIFIKYQGTVGLLGDYNDMEGIFFGARGYERGEGYNQNQGFVLWAIAEHVWYSGDFQWLEKVMDPVLNGCKWILREREIFHETLMNDGNVQEKDQEILDGLLPPGGVEDLKDFWFWLSTNTYNSFGLAQAAHLLNAAGHQDAGRILAGAKSYILSVRNAFMRAMENAPVIRLKDGTYQPHFPCRALRRGRGFGWIQECLEGAMHLIRCWIIHPLSMDAAWILKDHEDNLYLSSEYGYPMPNDEFDRHWFNRGGFSMQPWLLCGYWPYLLRGEGKHFVRAFYNSFAVNFRRDTRSMCEHPLPTMMDVKGDFFKTSDEANFTTCLRDMLVQEIWSELEMYPHVGARSETINDMLGIFGGWEKIDSLRIMYNVPREWWNPGKGVRVKRLPTYFGFFSLDFHVNLDQGMYRYEIEFSPREIGKTLKKMRFIFFKIRYLPENYEIDEIVIDAKVRGRESLEKLVTLERSGYNSFHLKLAPDFDQANVYVNITVMLQASGKKAR
ncbi:MAG: hypothetical protein ACTSUE_03715 [Promethearchaeota archaeon]